MQQHAQHTQRVPLKHPPLHCLLILLFFIQLLQIHLFKQSLECAKSVCNESSLKPNFRTSMIPSPAGKLLSTHSRQQRDATARQQSASTQQQNTSLTSTGSKATKSANQATKLVDSKQKARMPSESGEDQSPERRIQMKNNRHPTSRCSARSSNSHQALTLKTPERQIRRRRNHHPASRWSHQARSKI